MHRLSSAQAFATFCVAPQTRLFFRCAAEACSPQAPMRPTRRRSTRLCATPPPPSSASPSPANSDSDFEPTSLAPSLPDSADDDAFSRSPPPTRRRARRKSTPLSASVPHTLPSGPSRRSLTPSEVVEMRTTLLDWYVDNHRTLPWRSPPSHRKGGLPPLSRPAPAAPSSAGAPYAVWVSEVMSQQTRLSVVEGYFKRWMASFPDVRALADASLEQVNELWAGLGYYRRARFLHEGAKQIVDEYGGKLPEDVAQLLNIKGVGRYTAGAICSIAFGKDVPLVDGNVERVLARLCPGLTAPPAEGEAPVALPAAYWELAETLVKGVECPGDLNQAVMEFGATVCKPKAVQCSQCPIHMMCGAYQEAVQRGVEDPAEYVTKYPIKDPKKATKVRDETVAVLVVCTETGNGMKYLAVQRPGDGLLAGLWEAPNAVLDLKSETTRKETMDKLQLLIPQTLKDSELQKAKSQRSGPSGASALNVEVGKVTHIFSHIRQTLDVQLMILRPQEAEAVLASGATVEGIPFQWLSESELASAAISTQMKKVFAAAFKRLPRAKRVRR